MLHSNQGWLPRALVYDVATASPGVLDLPVFIDGSDYTGVQSVSLPELPCKTLLLYPLPTPSVIRTKNDSFN
jgi:hypothetical protein